MHITQQGESIFNLSRLYSCLPATLARLNNLNYDSALHINQAIKIPLGFNNFNQSEQAEGIRVFHKVAKGETMYGLSRKYAVPMAIFKNWNSLTGDTLKLEQLYTIGFIEKSKTVPQDVKVKPAPTPKPVIPHATKPLTIDTVTFVKPITQKPRATDTVVPKPISSNTNFVLPSTDTSRIENNFKELYMVQSRNNKDTAQVRGACLSFPSNNTNASNKYFVFFNNAPKGTIVKLKNIFNQKVIYAKVLGPLPGLKDDVKAVAKIDESARNALGFKERKFWIEISYPN
jgi:LysM repeat protein